MCQEDEPGCLLLHNTTNWSAAEFIYSGGRHGRSPPIKALDEAVKLANSKVFEKSESSAEYQGMGTTMVLCFIESGQLYVANVGDSRLYLLGDGLSQVTEDHSYVAAMVRAGEITEEEARFHPDKNMITRAIGVSETVRVDYFEVDLKNGDRILLCSDGLTNMVTDQEIGEILDQESPQQAVDDLIERAIDYGGADNITAIVVEPEKEEVTG